MRARLMGMVVALLATCLALVGPAAQVASATPIDPYDPGLVFDAWRTLLTPAPAMGFTGNVSTCTPGTTSPAYRAAELATVNALRGLAGVAPVTENATWSAMAQKTALMMAAKQDLSHAPGSTWPCHTADGATGAATSNLFLGAVGPAAMNGYVEDPGLGNEFVGHRRWMLCPTVSAIGLGDADSGSGQDANATKVFGDASAIPWAARDGVVAWPNPGIVPVIDAANLGLLDRFSIQVPIGHSTLGASVSITSDRGGPVTATALSRDDDPYCSPAVAWEPSRPPAENETWTITVNGLKDASNATYSKNWSTYFIGWRPGAPNAPQNVTATAGNGSATVSWTASTVNLAPVTGYRITPYVGNVAQTAQSFASTATSQTITGLVNGTTYTFHVEALSSLGSSIWGPPSPGVTPTGTPAAPTAVSATANGTDTVEVQWSAPVNDGGSPVTGYVVTPYIGATAQTPQTFPSTATTQTVVGLTRGTSYTLKVAAKNVFGTGAASSASAAVVAQGPPSAPTKVVGVAGRNQVTVTWTTPANLGGLNVGYYTVTAYVGPVAQAFVLASPGSGSAVVGGLTNGTAYTFMVTATNPRGTGPSSAPSAPVIPVAYAPFSSWGAFVDRQFQDLNAAPPSPSQRSAWVTALGTPSKTKGDLIEGLRRGPDNTQNVDPAARLYRALLGRTPDASGLRFWVSRRRTGTWTLTRMADTFASSSEFQRTYGTLTNRAYVTRIYTDVLDRKADAAGVDFWTRQLDQRRRSRGSVMVGFSESSEYKTKQAAYTDVAVAYIYLLGRTPTAYEVAAWVGRQQAGTSQATLAQELLESAAYTTHIAG